MIRMVGKIALAGLESLVLVESSVLSSFLLLCRMDSKPTFNRSHARNDSWHSPYIVLSFKKYYGD